MNDDDIALENLELEELEADAQYVREALKEQIIKLIEDSPAISAPVLIQRIRDL